MIGKWLRKKNHMTIFELEEKDIVMIGKWLRKKNHMTMIELGGEGYHDDRKVVEEKGL